MDDRISQAVLYGGPVLMAVGTIGNVLTIVIANSSKSFSRKPMGVYLTALAVVDLLMLDLGMLDYILFVKNLIVSDQHDVACRIAVFLVYFLVPMDGWIQATMSIERLVAVFFPLKVRILFTRKRALLGILLTILLVFAVESCFLWAIELQNVEYNGTNISVCLYTEEHLFFMSAVRPWLDLCVSAILPFLVMLITSVCIIGKVLWSNRKRQQTSTHSVNVSNMTRILLALSFSFLLLTAPVVTLGLVILMEDNGMLTLNDHDSLVLYNAFRWANFVLYFNYVANFYLYCMTSPAFRKELIFMMKRIVGKKGENLERVSTVNTVTDTAV